MLCIGIGAASSSIIETSNRKPIYASDTSKIYSFERKLKIHSNNLDYTQLHSSFFGNTSKPYTGPFSYYTSIQSGQRYFIPFEHKVSNPTRLISLNFFIKKNKGCDFIKLYILDIKDSEISRRSFSSYLDTASYILMDSLPLKSYSNWYDYKFDSLMISSNFILILELPHRNIIDEFEEVDTRRIELGTYRIKPFRQSIVAYKSNYTRVLDLATNSWYNLSGTISNVSKYYLPIYLKYETVY